MPFGVLPDDARQAIATIGRIASELGRQLDSLDVTIMVGLDGFTVELLQRYRDAGVNRLVVLLPQLPRQLTQIAEIVEHAHNI